MRAGRPEDRYSRLAILLHWGIALLILALLALGLSMVRTDTDPALQFSLFQWHKSFGLLVLVLSMIRLIHSVLFIRMAPVPGLAPAERAAARGVHALLLAFSLAVPLAGWLVASSSPLDIPTYAFNLVVVPHLPVTPSEAAEALWAQVHQWAAYLLLGLIALHAAAAFHHQFVRGDGVLGRMSGIRPAAKRPVAEDRITGRDR